MFLFFFFFLCSCTGHNPWENHDPSTKLKREDFLDLVNPEEVQPEEEEEIAVEDEIQIDPCFRKPVTLNVGAETPLQDVFRLLATQAGVGLAMDPKVEGSIIFSTKDRPLFEVVQDIAAMQNLRVNFHGNLMKISYNLPYLKNYDVKFLAMTRENNSSIASNISVLNTDGKGEPNGSSNVLKVTGINDFWKDLEENLKHILALSGDTWKDTDSEEFMTPEGEVIPKKKEEKKEKKQPFSINKQAGVITIYGTQEQHVIVEDFFKKLKKSVSTQVLIEAKIVEVRLNDEYRNGIQWSGLLGPQAANGFQAKLLSDKNKTDLLSLTFNHKNFNTMLSFIETFGSTRTLSSPRLTVLNNQMALLKVADNQVFFQVTYDRQYINSNMPLGALLPTSEIANSKIQTVPIGLIMSVQPSVDLESQEIILSLRPTITRVTETLQDPAVTLMSRNAGQPIISEIPVVAVREMDSVLRIKSGQIAILGGLMEEKSKNTEGGIPGTQEMPFKFLTRNKSDTYDVVELVIFLKATIVKNASLRGADKRLYKKYTKDPRPLTVL